MENWFPGFYPPIVFATGKCCGGILRVVKNIGARNKDYKGQIKVDFRMDKIGKNKKIFFEKVANRLIVPLNS